MASTTNPFQPIRFSASSALWPLADSSHIELVTQHYPFIYREEEASNFCIKCTYSLSFLEKEGINKVDRKSNSTPPSSLMNSCNHYTISFSVFLLLNILFYLWPLLNPPMHNGTCDRVSLKVRLRKRRRARRRTQKLMKKRKNETLSPQVR